jgi:hypothetical protein
MSSPLGRDNGNNPALIRLFLPVMGMESSERQAQPSEERRGAWTVILMTCYPTGIAAGPTDERSPVNRQDTVRNTSPCSHMNWGRAPQAKIQVSCGTLPHPLHAFTPAGTSLGTVHALAWVRDEADERWRSGRHELYRIQYECADR